MEKALEGFAYRVNEQVCAWRTTAGNPRRNKEECVYRDLLFLRLLAGWGNDQPAAHFSRRKNKPPTRFRE
jgi:hypothetical protein